MRTIRTKIYKFEELSKDAQENAIEKQRQWQYEYGEPLMFFSEICDEYFTRAGFSGTEIQYSLNYCQGDGLSFSADNYDNLENLYLEFLGKEKTAKLLAENTTVILKGNTGGYCYAAESQVDLYFEEHTSSINCLNIDNIENVQSQVLNKLETIYMDLCATLEEIGYKEIEYRQSDEFLKEDILANEYEFLIDGTQYN